MSGIELFYMLLGLSTVAVAGWLNRDLYGAGNRAGGVTALEAVYYVTALAGLLIGWTFNIAYMRQYGAEGGWWHWTTMLFVNPASSSAGQDLILANVIAFPLWTVVDGRRAGMRAPIWWFVMSVFTSFAFAMALYLAARERAERAKATRTL
jgi:hypothetical protein